MKTPPSVNSVFGQLLRETRESRGLSRSELGKRVGFDPSHLYRLEIGKRHPKRDSILALADALSIDSEAMNQWLREAGFAPMPVLAQIRAAVRTRGAKKRLGDGSSSPIGEKGVTLAKRLKHIGLHEAAIGALLEVLEKAPPADQEQVARAVRATLTRVTQWVQNPVRTAVIPAAGGQHRIVASHVMQRLLLAAISEAVESGISRIILVLAPGTVEPLYTPLKEALDVAVVPSVTLLFCEQAKPDGLGDAILHAEGLVGDEPFAVLLPDDIVRERSEGAGRPRELMRMIEGFRQLENASLLAVTSAPRSKMSQGGIVKLGKKEIMPNIHPIRQLVEKPGLADPICRSPHAEGIVGRYILGAQIFSALRELKEKGNHPLQLTNALERLRQEGQNIYAFDLKAARQDVGEVIGQASDLIGRPELRHHTQRQVPKRWSN